MSEQQIGGDIMVDRDFILVKSSAMRGLGSLPPAMK